MKPKDHRPMLGLTQYQFLAEILGDVNATGFHGGSISLTKLNDIFIEAMNRDNPRFDREKFIEWLMQRRAEAFLDLGEQHEPNAD